MTPVKQRTSCERRSSWQSAAGRGRPGSEANKKSVIHEWKTGNPEIGTSPERSSRPEDRPSAHLRLRSRSGRRAGDADMDPPPTPGRCHPQARLTGATPRPPSRPSDPTQRGCRAENASRRARSEEVGNCRQRSGDVSRLVPPARTSRLGQAGQDEETQIASSGGQPPARAGLGEATGGRRGEEHHRAGVSPPVPTAPRPH